MKYLLIKVICMLLVIGAIAACGNMPISTLYKMMKIDTSDLNPANGRYAFRLPHGTKISNGFPNLEIKFEKENKFGLKSKIYILQKFTLEKKSTHLESQKNDDHYIEIYRVNPKDKEELKMIFDYINAEETTDTPKQEGSMKVQFNLCILKGKMIKNIRGDMYWQLRSEEDFFTMLRNVNALDMYNKLHNSKADHLPTCEDK